ncbi:tetratricopeptide repeat protein, partial [Actinophytocola sp.]|uniref:tetratricopeptide repeat protein n=1 Tax=Actinophytocola sp. TaxID=1872138 RepID=UPI00389A6352
VGYLPLAIRLLAGRLRSRPTWTIEDLVAELAAAKDRSAAIRAENVIVGAVFDLSFNALPEPLKPLFRSLGLYPGVDFGVPTVAALAGTAEDEVRRGLDVLYDDHLVSEPTRGRFRLHDLVRDYARGLAQPEESHAAMTRLLAYYLDTADTAGRLLRGRAVGTAGGHLLTRADAVAWLDAELPNLVATIEHTAATHGTTAARLSHLLVSYLARNGHWGQAITLYETAHRAAKGAGDRQAEADALLDLGIMHRYRGQYGTAESCLTEALAGYEQLGDRSGRAVSLAQISVVHRMLGEYRVALSFSSQALELFRTVGDRYWTANMLSEIATVRALLGEHEAARQSAIAAVPVCRAINDRVLESAALRTLGVVEWRGGRLDDAEATLNDALRLARETGYRVGEADALHNLGIVLRLTGQPEPARALSMNALELFAELGDIRGQASALNELGTQAREDDPAEARRQHVLALRLAHSITNRRQEARAWEGIGRSLVAAGDVRGGVRRLRRALEFLRRLEDHDWRSVDALLVELEGGRLDGTHH